MESYHVSKFVPHTLLLSPSTPPPLICNLDFIGRSVSVMLNKMYKVVLMEGLGFGSRSIWPQAWALNKYNTLENIVHFEIIIRDFQTSYLTGGPEILRQRGHLMQLSNAISKASCSWWQDWGWWWLALSRRWGQLSFPRSRILAVAILKVLSEFWF